MRVSTRYAIQTLVDIVTGDDGLNAGVAKINRAVKQLQEVVFDDQAEVNRRLDERIRALEKRVMRLEGAR